MEDKIQYFIVKLNDNGMRLDRWLSQQFPNINNSIAQKLIRTGEIKLNKKKVEFNSRVSNGDEVRVPVFIVNNIDINKNKANKKQSIDINAYKKQIEDLKKNILYKDDDYIILNKPSGLSVQGGSGVVFSLTDALESLRFGLDYNPYIVHRIDKETSGILILARTRESSIHMLDLFKNKLIEKNYLAIVYPVLNAELSGVIDAPLFKDLSLENQKVEVSEEGKDAITNYNILNLKNNVALINFSPQTGRTHQIRVHTNYFFKASILGDYKYNFNKHSFLNILKKNFKFKDNLINEIDLRKMYLHAHKVKFKSQHGVIIDIICPIPNYFQAITDIIFKN
jgi:23S rRNA pseudouridine955/2504/2580 synthase